VSAAAAPSRMPTDFRARAQALVIGPSNLQAPLENMFARSHWKLEREANLASALERLATERFPAVLCCAAEWKKVVDAVARLDHPPMVIALSDEWADEDWLQALTSHVYVLDMKRLSAPEVFSLLSHAWRIASSSGL
jgi:hypothetical protein